jgi:hypothetical protein
LKVLLIPNLVVFYQLLYFYIVCGIFFLNFSELGILLFNRLFNFSLNLFNWLFKFSLNFFWGGPSNRFLKGTPLYMFPQYSLYPQSSPGDNIAPVNSNSSNLNSLDLAKHKHLIKFKQSEKFKETEAKFIMDLTYSKVKTLNQNALDSFQKYHESGNNYPFTATTSFITDNLKFQFNNRYLSLIDSSNNSHYYPLYSIIEENLKKCTFFENVCFYNTLLEQNQINYIENQSLFKFILNEAMKQSYFNYTLSPLITELSNSGKDLIFTLLEKKYFYFFNGQFSLIHEYFNSEENPNVLITTFDVPASSPSGIYRQLKIDRDFRGKDELKQELDYILQDQFGLEVKDLPGGMIAKGSYLPAQLDCYMTELNKWYHVKDLNLWAINLGSNEKGKYFVFKGLTPEHIINQLKIIETHDKRSANYKDLAPSIKEQISNLTQLNYLEDSSIKFRTKKTPLMNFYTASNSPHFNNSRLDPRLLSESNIKELTLSHYDQHHFNFFDCLMCCNQIISSNSISENLGNILIKTLLERAIDQSSYNKELLTPYLNLPNISSLAAEQVITDIVKQKGFYYYGKEFTYIQTQKKDSSLFDYLVSSYKANNPFELFEIIKKDLEKTRNNPYSQRALKFKDQMFSNFERQFNKEYIFPGGVNIAGPRYKLESHNSPLVKDFWSFCLNMNCWDIILVDSDPEKTVYVYAFNCKNKILLKNQLRDYIRQNWNNRSGTLLWAYLRKELINFRNRS